MGVEQPKPIELVRPVCEARHEVRMFALPAMLTGLLVACGATLWTACWDHLPGEIIFWRLSALGLLLAGLISVPVAPCSRSPVLFRQM